jgi:hypothetical protein
MQLGRERTRSRLDMTADQERIFPVAGGRRGLKPAQD